jgi:hypothetical protein
MGKRPENPPPPLGVRPFGKLYAVSESYCVLGAFRTREEAEKRLAEIVQKRAEKAAATDLPEKRRQA